MSLARFLSTDPPPPGERAEATSDARIDSDVFDSAAVAIRDAIKTVAAAIAATGPGSPIGPSGYYVETLTDAVMHVAGSLDRMAEALTNLALAVAAAQPDSSRR